MAAEIERKYLAAGDGWREAVRSSCRLQQGYLAMSERRSVRVRVGPDGATLTVKAGGGALVREETEVPLDPAAARLLLQEAREGAIIDKTRHLVPLEDGLTAEIDEFHGENAGLVVIEVELPDPDTPVPATGWFGPEVTDDPRYLNVQLARHPYRSW